MADLQEYLGAFGDEEGKMFTLGIRYEKAQLSTISLPIREFNLLFHQDLPLGVGGVVWQAAEYAIEYISQNCGVVLHKRVIDLGSGTGVVGLATAVLGAEFVKLTDLDAFRPLMQKNLEENMDTIRNTNPSCIVQVDTLDWNVDIPQIADFDLILCSDCLYDQSSAQLLIQLLLWCANSRAEMDGIDCLPRFCCILAFKRRYPKWEKECLEALNGSYNMEFFWKSAEDLVLCKMTPKI